MFDEKQVTTILFIYLQKICCNSSLTALSEPEYPGTSAFVESPIRAKSPSLPK